MSQRLIDENSQRALREKFGREMRDEVSLSVFVGPTNKEYCDFTVQLAEELHELDSRIVPIVYDDGSAEAGELGITRTPTVLIGRDQGYKVTYTGAPIAEEAGAFIETICLISRGVSGLQEDSKTKLQTLDRNVAIQVYVAPNCSHCPRAALLANQIAIECKAWVQSECVEASQNMDLARELKIDTVPRQLINGDVDAMLAGVQQEGAFVNEVLRYGSSRYAEMMAAEEAKRALAERLVDVPSAPLVLTDRTFDQAIAKYPVLVVDCWAEWCGPCRMVAPVIEALAHDYEGRIAFGKLDVDGNRAVAERYRIMSIPTLLIFKGGALAGTKVGALPRDMLEAELLKYVQ